MADLLRAGDTHRLVWELGDDDGPVDLRLANRVRLVLTGPKPADDVALDIDLTVLTAAGQVALDPDGTLSDGWYDADFTVYWPDSTQRTFPSYGPRAVRVVPVASP